ncbi:MAG: hypothetical protein HS126_27410 [Anaerolineales bacterium]|nr:hypothetical protein [Anaerolineales bacterium]
MPKKFLALLLPILFLMWLPGPALAQGPLRETDDIDWQELKTEKFIIVYADRVSGLANLDCSCGVDEAERYAAFSDQIYDDLVAIFEVEINTPINLRLFPTEESYYEVNPLARQLTGVIAHALNSRDEIAIALPRTKNLTDDEIVNNIRHELTHFFASFLSDGKLKAGFQEGIAQYLEKPTDRANYDPAILQQAFEAGRLLTWSELDQAESVYSDPQVAYPQSLSIVSFLVDRYSFPSFVKFLQASATEPGFRSAVQTAYGQSADELEQEWLAYLPEYFAGRWQINAIYAYDLSRVTELVNKAAYTDAAAELAEIVTLLETTNQTDTLAKAEALLARAHQGQTAGTLADEARQALQSGNYPLVIEKGNAAINTYEALNYRQRIPEIQVYIHRAELGQGALDQLSRGEHLLGSFRFFEAENQLQQATVLLQSLGNQAGAEQGQALLLQSAWQQSLLAYLLLAVGLTILVFNGLRRLINRVSADPMEIEFT